MIEQDVPLVSQLLAESWRRTYGPIVGLAETTKISNLHHSPKRLAEELADTNKVALVAERSDGSLAGYAMTEMDAQGDVMLDRLHIERSEFGNGLAADLLQAVLAAHACLPSITLEVLEGNDRALAFYHKHGFEVVDRKPASYGSAGRMSLIMRKLLRR
ncbi:MULTISPECIES: GNAT family N-acetyltransferase [unclassified Mesorhizobium]|uniref:GNAT family N-acetyltransferase n=1 Tax=unclassified Mesorhizobium TaxID=325217 RepID=UPI001FEE1547|nr:MULTISPECIES: GNAT family N-acetyltransferase [unclassified Mesorhizobium]